MKKILLQAFMCLTFFSLNAQESYTIKMNVRAEGLPPEYAAYSEQDIVTYIKGNKSKTELSSMMFSSTVFFDGKQMTSLNDMMGNKSGYTATKEELESSGKDRSKPKIEYVDEKRTIAGYECSKAIVTSTGKDKKEIKTIVWYTEKIKLTLPKGPSRNMNDFGDLKGHALAMETTTDMEGNEVKFLMTTTEISTDNLDDALFVPNTEGYKMMTFKEFQDQMKAAQKGH